MERAMPRPGGSEIFMLKKSAEGFRVAFRRGSDHGVRPGMRLAVVNEDGLRVGAVEVVACTPAESEALVSRDRGIHLGCRVQFPPGPASA
jgi:hypothetical protein